MSRFSFLAFIAFLAAAAPASEVTVDAPGGDAVTAGGQVTLPLDQYQVLLQQAVTQPLPAPSDFAVGQAELAIRYLERDGHITATVNAEVAVETFNDGWVLVALLAPGAALESALVDGAPVQLVQRPEGLFWLADGRRRASVQLVYHVDARYADKAWVSALPIPRAAATRFTIEIPRLHIDLAVAPAANLVKSESGNLTRLTGTAGGSPGLMVTWRVAAGEDYVLSQAAYQGRLKAGAVLWQAEIDAELFTDGEVAVPLVTTATTLVGVTVDGEPATVFNKDGHFHVRLSGAGRHRIGLGFQSPVTEPEGMPTTAFDVPAVPVSKFELRLPGEKLLTVAPATQVEIETAAANDGRDMTLARFYIPLSQRLSLSWMEAIPQGIDVEKRANAVVYHALRAAEGVLYGLASIAYEITRGESHVLEFTIPAGAQVNRIHSQGNAVADWIEVSGEAEAREGHRHIRVFLNRAVTGEFVLDVEFERLLDDAPDGQQQRPAIAAPLIRALGVTRQKGMVALLSGSELALAPSDHPEMSEVGENQLPAFFRNRLAQSEGGSGGYAVSHTFKYHSADAALTMQTVAPERVRGKFNAQVDTLVSIGEVTLSGQVGIENDVKSGALRELVLWLPADVNILGVTGPSIRHYEIGERGGRQQVAIEFTREMDGLFRVELNYERIMVDGAIQTTVPRVEVEGADVQHGRIAIEALTALEVQPGRVAQLSSMEINELPRQLVLKTTNPILLAYKYVNADQSFVLELTITRHDEIDVQVAAIDSADYTTLFTSDGLAVTRVRFDVRNSRRQFLRLSLPADSEIWSVFVNGDAQKPAFAGDKSSFNANHKDVLIKMINSATAFPVELVYATRGDAMGQFGSLAGRLPQPDMIVTRSNWDVYVPAEPRYGKPDTNMQLVTANVLATVRDATEAMLRGVTGDAAGAVSSQPLRIELPTQGLLFRFAKLYANQAAEGAYFSMRYVQSGARFAGLWLSLLGAAALWAGIALLSLRKSEALHRLPPALPAELPWMLIGGGAGAVVLALTALGAGARPPAILSLILALVFLAWRTGRFPLFAR